MGSMETRIARLERHEEDTTAGVGVWGIKRVNAWTGDGPDAVTLPDGAVVTEAEFRRRYPAAILVVRQEFGRGDGAEG